MPDDMPIQAGLVSKAIAGAQQQVEAMNFGIGWYTSAHSVVNFVPNVMDFNRAYGIPTPENEFFLKDVGVREGEIALLQVTRIVRRKGIETAISLIDKLDDKKLKLVITGNNHDDENKEYYNELIDQIHDLNLSRQVIFASHKVLDHKDLSDVYAHGRACTYFSTYEGFGNAFVEAVLGKTPIFVNNYEPVYWPDIGSKGFEAVMIENNKLDL